MWELNPRPFIDAVKHAKRKSLMILLGLTAGALETDELTTPRLQGVRIGYHESGNFYIPKRPYN